MEHARGRSILYVCITALLARKRCRTSRSSARHRNPPPPPPRFLFINYLSRTAMTVTTNSMNGRAPDMTHSNDDRFIESSRERENNRLGRANLRPLTHFPICDILFPYSPAKSTRVFLRCHAKSALSCIHYTFTTCKTDTVHSDFVS